MIATLPNIVTDVIVHDGMTLRVSTLYTDARDDMYRVQNDKYDSLLTACEQGEVEGWSYDYKRADGYTVRSMYRHGVIVRTVGMPATFDDTRQSLTSLWDILTGDKPAETVVKAADPKPPSLSGDTRKMNNYIDGRLRKLATDKGYTDAKGKGSVKVWKSADPAGLAEARESIRKAWIAEHGTPTEGLPADIRVTGIRPIHGRDTGRTDPVGSHNK